MNLENIMDDLKVKDVLKQHNESLDAIKYVVQKHGEALGIAAATIKNNSDRFVMLQEQISELKTQLEQKSKWWKL